MHLTKDDSWAAHILQLLVGDARRSMRQLASYVGLSPSATAERVRRLEDLGVICGYGARIDRSKLGWTIEAFATISAREGRCSLLLSELKMIPNVIAAYHVTGDADYVARITARNLDELRFVTEALSNFGSVSTRIILGTSFEREVHIYPQRED